MNINQTVREFEKLKDRYEEKEKEKKDIERKYASIKEVYEQTKILSEQTKTKLKNLHQEKGTFEKVIKALRSMTKTKIYNVPDRENQTKQLQISLEKEKKLVERIHEENRNKYDQSEANHNTKNYENRLKEVTKLQDDVKRINKEKEGEQKRLSVEIDNNKKKKIIEKIHRKRQGRTGKTIQ